MKSMLLGETKSNSVDNHTIVIKAMCDLVTDHHADATIVERFSLAFAEERRLQDTCRENWHQGERKKKRKKEVAIKWKCNFYGFVFTQLALQNAEC